MNTTDKIKVISAGLHQQVEQALGDFLANPHSTNWVEAVQAMSAWQCWCKPGLERPQAKMAEDLWTMPICGWVVELDRLQREEAKKAGVEL